MLDAVRVSPGRGRAKRWPASKAFKPGVAHARRQGAAMDAGTPPRRMSYAGSRRWGCGLACNHILGPGRRPRRAGPRWGASRPSGASRPGHKGRPGSRMRRVAWGRAGRRGSRLEGAKVHGALLSLGWTVVAGGSSRNARGKVVSTPEFWLAVPPAAPSLVEGRDPAPLRQGGVHEAFRTLFLRLQARPGRRREQEQLKGRQQ